MNTQLLIIFTVANIANVVIQTAKTIVTVKCGKVVASLINAVAYGLYTYVIILTVCDLPTFWKALIVAGCNLVGVFVVKAIEEKTQKSKLWKIECTVSPDNAKNIETILAHISHSTMTIDSEHTLFNFYCNNKEQTKEVKKIVDYYHAKYFISESKNF